jgi:hypothetical protein
MTEPITFGRRFGRGVVLDPDIGRERNGHRLARLLCHPHEGGCGTVYEARVSHLHEGLVRSCGCLRHEWTAQAGNQGNRTHGLYNHPLYETWRLMIRRCEDPRDRAYPRYGGRVPPVTVWGPWHDAARFIADVEAEIGPRPPGRTASGKRPLYTLDRRDNDGNYEPGNIRWATWPQQRRNQTATAGGAR